MSSTWGNILKLSIFGESHGEGIGVVLDGLPAGEPVDLDEVAVQMARRAPGRDLSSTPRKESDAPKILSGLIGGHTTGAPLCAVIYNQNTRSQDYESLRTNPRPGHADYTGYVRYHNAHDVRGGGHFSGRLTAPLVFAGSVCRQMLERRGVVVGGHVFSIAGIADTPFDPVKVDAEQLKTLSQTYFPLIARAKEEEMRVAIEKARLDCDSVGGIAEVAAVGLPAGLGSPMFGGVENRLASLLFGIPAMRGLEFGSGFSAASLRGSQHNDPFCIKDGSVATVTNHHGGVLGGITSGMPLIFRAAFKPTPSIAKEQQTVDLTHMKEVPLSIHGRHDPCIVPRAVPVAEAAAAIVLMDLMMEGKCYEP